MKGAILTQLNAPLTIADDLGCPGPDYGQVMVDVLVSGICGAQLQEVRGEKGGPLPHLLGHEGAGIVRQVGLGVTRVAEGDKVVLHWRQAKGIDSDFPRYLWGDKWITSGKVNTLAETVLVSENRVTKVPDDTPPELCALLGCGLSTALGTVENDADIKFGESVLIVGTGGLGTNLIRAASLRQAHPITCVDVHESKRALAREMGAHRFCNCATETLTGSYDVIIDTAGNPQTMANAIPLLNPSGRYVMVGQPKPGESVTLSNAIHLFSGEGKSLRATQGGGFRPDVDLPRYINMHKAGLLKIDGIITHRVGLDDINDALDMVRKGEAGRILVDMSL